MSRITTPSSFHRLSCIWSCKGDELYMSDNKPSFIWFKVLSHYYFLKSFCTATTPNLAFLWHLILVQVQKFLVLEPYINKLSVKKMGDTPLFESTQGILNFVTIYMYFFVFVWISFSLWILPKLPLRILLGISLWSQVLLVYNGFWNYLHIAIMYSINDFTVRCKI